MHWTTETPKARGWYWLRLSPSATPEPVWLSLLAGMRLVSASTWQAEVGKRKVREGVALWAGPLVPPPIGVTDMGVWQQSRVE